MFPSRPMMAEPVHTPSASGLLEVFPGCNTSTTSRSQATRSRDRSRDQDERSRGGCLIVSGGVLRWKTWYSSSTSIGIASAAAWFWHGRLYRTRKGFTAEGILLSSVHDEQIAGGLLSLGFHCYKYVCGSKYICWVRPAVRQRRSERCSGRPAGQPLTWARLG